MLAGAFCISAYVWKTGCIVLSSRGRTAEAREPSQAFNRRLPLSMEKTIHEEPHKTAVIALYHFALMRSYEHF